MTKSKGVKPKQTNSRLVRTKRDTFVEGSFYPANTIVRVSKGYYDRVKLEKPSALEVIN